MTLTGTIGGPLKADPDLIHDGQAMPNATNASSSAFRLGGVQSGEEIVVSLDQAITLTNGLVLQFELMGATTESGDYTSYSIPYTKTASGSEVLAAGEICRIGIPTDAPRWGKIKTTTTQNLSGDAMSAWKEPVSR